MPQSTLPFHQILLPHDNNEPKVNLVQAASEMGQCEKYGLRMGRGFQAQNNNWGLEGANDTQPQKGLLFLMDYNEQVAEETEGKMRE